MTKDMPKDKSKTPEAGPDIPPKGRETSTKAQQKRRADAPAAAPRKTDAESGGASAASGTPRDQAPRDPARPHPDEARQSASHEVRAGPGDAGKQRSPEVLPKTPRTPRSSAARLILWFVVPLLILMGIYAAFVV